MVDSLTLFFGKKRGRKVKRSPGRKPKRGHGVRKLLKSQSYITVGNRKRKLYKGANGGLYYRTRSGRHYVPSAVLRRKRHMLSPKRGRKARRGRKGRKGRKARKRRKGLLQSKAAKKRRRAYRKANPKRRRRKSRFGFW